eukprot:gene6795-8451_t
MQMKPQPSLKKLPTKAPAERVVKDIRRATRRHFSAEDKIRIVLDGLNEAESGRPVIVEIFRWKAPPAEELALIDAQNPGKLLSKGEVLADQARPVGESPFYRITWL